jgi:hypothetical protein
MPDGRGVAEPRWMRVVVVGAAVMLTSFGGVGLLLADLGLYRWWLVLPLAVPALLVLFALVNPVLRVGGEVADRDTNTLERTCARIALAIAGLSVLWNGLNASQHAQINRDGGLYLNAGKWISSHGTLNVEPFAGPFAQSNAIVVTSNHMKLEGSHLEFNLPHLLSAVLAEAHSFGGTRLMFLTVPLVSGFALLAFYLLASRVIRHPVAALAAMATLAFVMPQMWFSRDSVTEIPIQLVLFAAVWLLCDPRTLRIRGAAFTVGLLLGSLPAMQTEALVLLAGLPAVFALLWLHCRRRDRDAFRRGFRCAAAGVAVGFLVAALDMIRWNRSWWTEVNDTVVRIVIGEILLGLVAVLVVVLVRRARWLALIDRLRPNGAIVAGLIVAILGFAAWFVRPNVETAHGDRNDIVGNLQRLSQVTVDPTRRYAELTMRWVSWYLGPMTLMLAIIAAALLTVVLVRGDARIPIQVATLMLAPATLVFLWRPAITPDQVWAAGRFLPAVFPAMILLTFGLLYHFAIGSGSEFASQRYSIAIVVGAVAVAFPFITIKDVSRMNEQRGQLSAITRTCDTMPSESAVVMLPEVTSLAYRTVPQTLRGFCNVPVAVMKNPVNIDAVRALASGWKQDGRQLYVVSEYAQTIRQVFPRARVHSSPRKRNPHHLEQTLTRRPSHYRPDSFQLSIAAVPIPGEPAPDTSAPT